MISVNTKFRGQNFPSDEAYKNPNTEKGRKYWVQATDAMMGTSVVNNPTLIGDAFNILRAYGDGNQPKEKYYPVLNPEFGNDKPAQKPSSEYVQKNPPSQWAAEFRNNSEGKPNYANLDFEIYSVAPKIGRIIRGLLGDVNDRPRVESKSPQHMSEKLRRKNEMWFYKVMADVLQKIEAENGVTMKKPNFVPKNKLELDIYEAAGGFKVVLETAFEKIIQHAFDISEYTSVIEPQVIDDYKDWCIGALRDYTDPETFFSKIQYVSPNEIIAVWNRNDQFSSSPYVARYEKITIKQLREEIMRAHDKEFIREDFIVNLLRNNSTIFNTFGTTINDLNFELDPITLTYAYDPFEVTVLRWEYLTKEVRKNSIEKNEKGYRYYEDDEPHKDFDEEYEKKHNKKRDCISYTTRYIGNRVVGTDIIYGVQEAKNLKRPTTKTVQSDYHLYKIKGQSITKNLISLYDRLQQIHLKYQQHILHALPPGIAIEITSMAEMVIGGKKYDLFDFLKIYYKSGSLMYSASVKQGKIVNNGMPFQELKGGLGEGFATWIAAYQDTIQQIFNISGITEAVQAAGSISGEKGLGVQQNEIQATNNNLKSIKLGLRHLKQSVARGIVLRTVTNICADTKVAEAYESIIGPTAISAIKELMKTEKGLTLEAHNIIIESAPDTQQARDLLEAAKINLQPNKDGVPGLDYEEYFYITSCVYQNRLEEGQRFLSYTMARKKEDFEKSRADAMKIQGEENRKTQEQAAAIELKKETDAHQRKLEEIRVTEEEKRKTVILQEQEKRKTILATKEIQNQE